MKRIITLLALVLAIGATTAFAGNGRMGGYGHNNTTGGCAYRTTGQPGMGYGMGYGHGGRHMGNGYGAGWGPMGGYGPGNRMNMMGTPGQGVQATPAAATTTAQGQ